MNEVTLAQPDKAPFDAEQIDDLEMLPRLRHRPIIGGDDPQPEVHARCARYHVVDETLVTRHIHRVGRADSWHGAIREAEIDRAAARLFLGQPIGIDTG